MWQPHLEDVESPPHRTPTHSHRPRSLLLLRLHEVRGQGYQILQPRRNEGALPTPEDPGDVTASRAFSDPAGPRATRGLISNSLCLREASGRRRRQPAPRGPGVCPRGCRWGGLLIAISLQEASVRRPFAGGERRLASPSPGFSPRGRRRNGLVIVTL